jgi:CRP-like cAMP-binding protein/Fe-S-cluster-containing hydrogenase component 2/thioredoxin reductase
MAETFKIAIVGSGPSGLSAAGHAAELGVAHVLLEAGAAYSNTIQKYQKGKHVMAEPGILPLRSPMSFGAGTREGILAKWGEELARYQVNVRYGAQVVSIQGEQGSFRIGLATGETVEAENVVLAIGMQGNIRKLGTPGEDLSVVQYQLDDPEEYSDETIIVVGAGDAGIENALALAKQNRVILVNRNDEFVGVKEGNISLVGAAVKEGRLELRTGTRTVRVEAPEGGAFPALWEATTPEGAESIPCHRIIARLGALPPRGLVEGFGVVFPSKDRSAVPRLSDRYESNRPGIFVVGALGGCPLIKQAMNQGYEVVEHILGRPVEAADEPLLVKKFSAVPSLGTVSDGIARIQANVPLFAGLTTLQLREFLVESELSAPKEGQVIFARNDYSNSFFSIVEGRVIVEAATSGGEAFEIHLPAGEFFGEMGLISGRRRSTTVKAGPGCVLVETPRRSMLKLMASVESVQRELDHVFLKRAVRSYVAGAIPDADLDFLVEEALIKRFAAGEPLFMEGDAPDGLHLIRRGSVTISRQIGGKELVLSYVAAGNYVGEMALMSDKPRSATVRAAVAVESIILETSRFKEVLARNAGMRAVLDAQLMGRMRANESMEDQAESGSLITFLMKQGIGEATDVLLIDQSLCVRCNNCEKACGDVHDGTSRLHLEAGPSMAQIHVPTSCRHCEHPHCMKDCPPDAIHRSQNGEVYIADTCIGCGNCQQNCPYGVIQMALINPKRKRPSLLSWLTLGIGAEPGKEKQPTDHALSKHAVKCDMCKDLSGGPACVRACPTGAALRVSPERFLDFAARGTKG